jgi:hypothetical protein
MFPTGSKPLIKISALLKPDLFVAAWILVLGLKFTYGLENVLDVGLHDETTYLYNGVRLTALGFPVASFAPLYAVWYGLISLFTADRIQLYFLNYKLMTILPPVFTYLLLRLSRVPADRSLIFTWFVLIARINVNTCPRVAHFALMIILCTLALIGRRKSWLACYGLAATGALFVSYVRPEYFLTCLLSLALLLILSVREWKKLKRRHQYGLAIFGLIAAAFVTVLGFPMGGGNHRSLVAFGQHFSLNWIRWNASDLNPWTNCPEILSRTFGPVRNMPEAAIRNFPAFFHHIACNCEIFLKRLPELILPVNCPINILNGGTVVALMACVLIAFRSRVRQNLTVYKNLFIATVLFLLPSAVSILLIYPRDHYLLVPSVLIAVTMTISLTSPQELKGKPTSPRSLFLLGALLFLLTPNFFLNRKEQPRPNLKVIRVIQKLKIDRPVNILETEGGYGVYAGDRFCRIMEYHKNLGFNDFLNKENIRMIVITEKLLKDTRFRHDPEWLDFLMNYSQYGYLQENVPGTDNRIIFQADLLRGTHDRTVS